MQPTFYAGLALIALAIIVFFIEGKDLRGFGPLAAWFRITVFVIGLVLVALSLTTKANAEPGAAGQPATRLE
ncbi:MAG TPA: hypothetical protein PLN52_26285 [Opitutaceae bacterium]|nr:hypothetical protein [Opitutaceae bacterium]